jgi:hypothetical protein
MAASNPIVPGKNTTGAASSPDEKTLTVWTVYCNPHDYPRKWVLRGFDIGPGWTRPHTECVVVETLEKVRAALPPGLTRLPRNHDDDSAIYETWI